jgi:hypothetical protein
MILTMVKLIVGFAAAKGVHKVVQNMVKASAPIIVENRGERVLLGIGGFVLPLMMAGAAGTYAEKQVDNCIIAGKVIKHLTTKKEDETETEETEKKETTEQ